VTPFFYCENCHQEVSANDKVCPSCGRFFTDVRCPRCNHSGDVDEFSLGCPKCGYLNPTWVRSGAVSASNTGIFEFVSPKIFNNSAFLSESQRGKYNRLNSWLFLSVTLGLGIIGAALMYILIR